MTAALKRPNKEVADFSRVKTIRAPRSNSSSGYFLPWLDRFPSARRNPGLEVSVKPGLAQY